MAKYRINVANYEVDVQAFERQEGQIREVSRSRAIDVREELYGMLRLPGVYKTLADSCEAIILGRKIRESEEDVIELTAEDLSRIKLAMDKLVSQDHEPSQGKYALGGPAYEELMLRIYQAEEIN